MYSLPERNDEALWSWMHMSGSLVTHPPARTTDSPCMYSLFNRTKLIRRCLKDHVHHQVKVDGTLLCRRRGAGVLLQFAALRPVLPNLKQTRSPAMALPLALIPSPFDLVDMVTAWIPSYSGLLTLMYPRLEDMPEPLPSTMATTG